MPRPLSSLALAAGVALLVAACADDSDSSGGDDPSSTTTSDPTEERVADWPMFGHDYDNSRHSPDSGISAANVADLEVRWRVDAASVTSTPAVVEGIVYFADWDGGLNAVEADTGATVWRTSLQSGQLSPSPYVDDDRVYIAGDGGMVFAVDRETGVEEWGVDIESAPLDRVWSSPVVVDDTVIIGSASFQVFAPADPPFRGSIVGLDATTGDERWRASVCDDPCTGVSVWSSAAVDPDLELAYIGTGQSYSGEAGPMSDSIVAVDYTTGEIAWHHQFTAGDTYSTTDSGPDFDVGAAPNLFTIGAIDAVGVGDKGGTYKAFDRATGEVLWETDLVPGTPLGGIEHTAAYADGAVYLVANTGIAATSRADAVPSSSTAFALDAATGDTIWSTELDAGGFGGVSIANGLMWFTTHEGTLRALDVTDGTEVWSTSVGDSSASGPVVVDGTLYVGFGWGWVDNPPGGVVALAP